MLSKHGKIKLSAVLVAMIFAAPVWAGDAERGKQLADTCEGCHAVDSYTNVYPTYHVPRIAGQSEAYLDAALKLYRNGDRPHSTMKAQGGSLSDQDIADIAAFLATVGPELNATAEASGEAPAAAAICAACHGQAGVSSIPTNPHLAGQHLDYLQEATNQYKSGARKGPNAIAMQAQMNAISEEDLEAVLKFYASQDGLTVLPMD